MAFSRLRSAIAASLTWSSAPKRKEEADANSMFRSPLARRAWRMYTQRLTPAGRWFLWPSFAFLTYSLTSLELQIYVPFAYATGVWLVALVGCLFFGPKTKLTALHAERVCEGEVLPIAAEIENVGRWSGVAHFVVPHRLPAGFQAVPPYGGETVLARGSKSRVALGLRCERRGAYTLNGFRVETDFPLGLIRAHQVFEAERTVLVYPRFTPLARVNLPSGRRYQPGGVNLASLIGDSAEFIGNREFREGDNLRNIDWSATARLQRPIVREYREEYFVRMAVILDTHVPESSGEERRMDFERAVSITAAIADYLSRQEYLVDLFAAGPNMYHLTAGRSLAYLDQILDILACVEESTAEPFNSIAAELVEDLAQITTIVFVFLDWNERRRAFVESMREQGVGIKVIVVRNAKCSQDPVSVLAGLPVIRKNAFDLGIEEL